jgi:hypothetical protein
MTENEWLASTEPTRLLQSLKGTAHPSARKARLFAVAACRRIWHLLPHDRSRNAVEVAERYADGAASRQELAAAQTAIRDTLSYVAYRQVRAAAASAARYAAGFQRYYATWQAAVCACWAAGRAAVAVQPDVRTDESMVQEARKVEAAVQAELFRDILGLLPFRKPHVDPRWRTPAVVSLARAAYEERSPPDQVRSGWLILERPRLLILADALEEAGADDAEILGHLRRPEEHVRGCWCVDLLLDKE